MNAMPTVAKLDVPRVVVLAWLPKRTQQAGTWSGKSTEASGLKALASPHHLPQETEILATTARPFSIANEAEDQLRELACREFYGPSAEDLLWELQHICLCLAQHCQIITRHLNDLITIRAVDFARLEPQIDRCLVTAVQGLSHSDKTITRAIRLVDHVSRDGPDLIVNLVSIKRLDRFDGGQLKSHVLSVMHWLNQVDTKRLPNPDRPR